MGSDVQAAADPFGSEEFRQANPLDPLSALRQGEEGGDIGSALDPLDIFGFQKAGDIEEQGVASRARIVGFMRAANAMRENVLARIKDRDLQASKAVAGARRAGQLRTGRSSTILSR